MKRPLPSPSLSPSSPILCRAVRLTSATPVISAPDLGQLRMILGIGLMATALLGCGGSDHERNTRPGDQTSREIVARPADAGTATLKTFDGDTACDSLESYIEDSLLAETDAPLSALRSGSTPARKAAQPPAPADQPRLPVSMYRSPPATTGEPIAGVEQGDFVSRDGSRLWILADQNPLLQLTRVEPAAHGALAVTARAQWNSHEQAAGLHRLGNGHLVALSTANLAIPFPHAPGLTTKETPPPPVVRPTTRIRVVDGGATDLPTLWTVDLPGTLKASRRVGTKIQVITKSSFALPSGVRTAGDVIASTDPADRSSVIDQALVDNERLIRAQPLQAWLDQAAVPTLAQCQTYLAVDAPTRLGTVTLATVDTATRTLTRRTVLARLRSVHLSATATIVATADWVTTPDSDTYLHRFVIDDGNDLAYDNSHRIGGVPISAKAISETATGQIRVATRERDATGTIQTYLATYQVRPMPAPWQSIGRTPALAVGEDLASASFIGDRAYLASTRFTEPLLVFDVSADAPPSRIGSLPVPGLLSWVQPIGDRYTLAIADAGKAGPERQVRATLIDTTDPAAPTALSSIDFPTYTTTPLFHDAWSFGWQPASAPIASPVPEGTNGVFALPLHPSALPPVNPGEAFGLGVLAIDPAAGADALRHLGSVPIGQTDPGDGSMPVRPMFHDGEVFYVTPLGVSNAMIEKPGESISTASAW